MGKIELDHTGSGGGITLSSDGTDLLLNGTAVGGGGGSPDLFAENYDGTSTAPSATGENAVAVGTGSGGAATASGFNAIALGVDAQSTGGASVAMAYSTASNSYTFSAAGGNSQTYGASGSNSVAIGASSNARGSSSIALGTSSYVDTAGTQAVALGDSYASGSHSLAGAIATNSSSYGATSAYSIAMGNRAKASGQYSIALGYQPQATGYYDVAIGDFASATGGFVTGGSIAIGSSAGATKVGSVAIGRRAYSNIEGKLAFTNNTFNNTRDGSAQYGLIVLKQSTTDATASTMTSDNNGDTADSPSTTNQVVLPNNSVYGFTGTVIAREDSSSTDDFAVWEIKGGAVRGASASTTALGSYNINKISESTGAANWSIALSADTTNGAVAITVTGEAAHNIRWVATVHTTEVTY